MDIGISSTIHSDAGLADIPNLPIEHPYIHFFDFACGPNKNCTEACQDPAYMFKSVQILQNYFLYPIISDAVAAGSVS